MKGKKTPIFDLRTGVPSELDIARFFQLSSPSAISHNRDTLWLDRLDAGQEMMTHDLSVSNTLEVYRFRTLDTLDLITYELTKLPVWRISSETKGSRSRVISIISQLRIPYGALDVRRGGTGVIGRKYADIFTRKLPFWLSIQGHYRLYHKLLFLWLSRLAYSLGVLFLLALPLLWFIKFSVESSLSLVSTLPSLTSNKEIIETTREIRGGFERSKLLLTPYMILLDNRLIHIDEIRALGGFIDAGTSLSRGLHSLAVTLDPNFVYHSSSTSREAYSTAPIWRGESHDFITLERYGILSPTDWLRENHKIFEVMLGDIEKASKHMEGVDFVSNTRVAFLSAGHEFLQILSRMGRFYLTHTDDILRMLGNALPQRYIILNQNQDELRANGGFPGSVITLTLYKGNILDFRKDDVYYYDWNLFPYKEVPPPGLALLTDNFGLRDVNYFPIFRESVEKANEFIEKSGDSTITTGIALHQGIIIDILREVGPITLSGMSMPITHENFSALMSTLVEAKHAELISPKDILFNFIDTLITQIREKKLFMSVLKALDTALRNGEILIASRDEDIQSFLGTIGYNEGWLQDEGNWIYPIFTSLSGNKSDRYMKRVYSGSTRMLTGCVVENTVTLQGTHTFNEKNLREINTYLDMIAVVDTKDREKLLFIEGNGLNKQYVRFIVPKSTELISSGGNFELIPGDRYATIAFMIETPQGATSERTVRYKTAPTNCREKLEWYRQPGLHALEIR